MKDYESLYKLHPKQSLDVVFSHFYPIGGDYDEPFKLVARQTIDGIDAWHFHQDRFKSKYPNTAVPKLKNYLNYTFNRLLDLEKCSHGEYFFVSGDGDWISFNTGLQNIHGADLMAIYQKYILRDGTSEKIFPDWVFKGCYPANDWHYRDHFGADAPKIAWYSTDSRDYVFDASYRLERDGFDHLFDRAKGRAGMPFAADEAIRNYLRGALENLVPKIKRNYKVAIPVFYVVEKRMQLLLPFASASDPNDISCFVIDRNDAARSYQLKTILDLDQAYFSARLITRPDKEWLNP
jgi:hypothetical protein